VARAGKVGQGQGGMTRRFVRMIRPAGPPDLPPELIDELKLFNRDKLIDINRGHPRPLQNIPLMHCAIDRKQLEEWIIWLAADEAWREARLSRIVLRSMWAAIAAAVISAVGVFISLATWWAGPP
jgi:hypothetical protein